MKANEKSKVCDVLRSMAFYESKHDSFLVFTLFITTLISSGSGKLYDN